MHFQARFWGLIDRLAINVEKINGMKTGQPNETWKLKVNEQPYSGMHRSILISGVRRPTLIAA